MTPCFVPRGKVLYTIIVPKGGFCPLRVVSRWFVWGGGGGGMVLDEIDTCIRSEIKWYFYR